MNRTKLSQTIATVAAALAVAVAAAPGASAATGPSKRPVTSTRAGQTTNTGAHHRIRARSKRPLPHFTRRDVVYVLVDSPFNSEHQVKCALFEVNINNELHEAQDAYNAGSYGDVSGHLTQASKIAAGAVNAGCDVSW